LFVASTTDAASVNIAKHLLDLNTWEEMSLPALSTNSLGKAYKIKPINPSSIVYLWLHELPLLKLDCIDKTFVSKYEISDCNITEAIFLSKHVAASGTVSLTVHPIGIPWQTEASRSGGLPGACSPPSTRMGALYREILNAKCSSEYPHIQITMEATHHGPYMEVPSCFVEIGSSDAGWGLPYAGQLWASCLNRHFGLPVRRKETPVPVSADAVVAVGDQAVSVGAGCELDSGRGLRLGPDSVSIAGPALDSEEASVGVTIGPGTGGVVVVGLGGGHYVPKMNDLARLGSGLFIGHTLASYTLERYFADKTAVDQKPAATSTNTHTGGAANDSNAEAGTDAEAENGDAESSEDVEQTEVPGGWRAIVREAIRSTRVSFPEQKLICMVDKKGFNARGRNEITAFLDEERVAWTYKSADVKKLLESS